MQDGKHTTTENNCKDSDEPAYRDPQVLSEAYAAADESIARTAHPSNASYDTVRDHLIKHGIHEPEPHESSADLLEGLDPEDLGLSPLEGGV